MHASLLSLLALGAAPALALPSVVLEGRALPKAYQPTGPDAANWATVGCANDLYPNARAFNGGYLSSDSLTISKCLAYCDSQGQVLAGIENANQCYCGPQLDNGAEIKVAAANLTTKNNGGCNVASAGSSSQNGGGSNRLLVFKSAVNVGPSPVDVANATYAGCYADDENNRYFPTTLYGNNQKTLTSALCFKACKAQKLDLCALEYGTQCFGAKSSQVKLTKSKKLPDTGCEYTLSGARTELGGGPSALSVYKLTL